MVIGSRPIPAPVDELRSIDADARSIINLCYRESILPILRDDEIPLPTDTPIVAGRELGDQLAACIQRALA